MAKFTPIRITENDRKEHRRLVRNARAKARRIKEQWGQDVSGDIKLDAIESFAERSEFNEWKEEMESFTSRYNTDYQFRKNKYGVVSSVKEIRRREYNRKMEQKRAREEIERIKDRPVHQGGKEFSTVDEKSRHMKDPSDVTGVKIPKEFDFDTIKDVEMLEYIDEVAKAKIEGDYYDKRKEQMHENYMDGLRKTFDSDAHELIEMVKELSPEDFYEIWLAHEEIDFNDFFYEDGEIQVVDPVDEIKKIELVLEKYAKGMSNVNDDLRPF